MTPIGTEIAGRNAIARDDQVTSIGFIAAARQGGEVGDCCFRKNARRNGKLAEGVGFTRY